MAVFRKRTERIRGIAGSLNGKNVLVANGTSGPGPGIVKVLAESGARVSFTGPDAVAVDLQLRALGSTPRPMTGIVTTASTGTERDQLIVTAVPPYDAVVINATYPRTAHQENDPDPPPPGMGLAPHDAMAMARLAAHEMKDGGREGAIVFITGIDRIAASATAIVTMRSEMEQLARRVAPNGIRVNAVAPGQVALNRRGHVVASRVAPLGHVSIHPVEVGKAVWFLINDDLSSGTTGATLKIDRGASLLRPEW